MIRTLTARLTLWYTALFGLLSLLAFSVAYVTLAANLNNRMDDELRREFQELAEVFRHHEQAAVARELIAEAESEGISRVFYRLYSPQLEMVASSDLSSWPELDTQATPVPEDTGGRLQTLILSEQRCSARVLTQALEGGYILQIGYLLQDDERLLEHFRESFGIGFTIALLGAALVGFLVARRAMAGLGHIQQATNHIIRGDFSRSVPLGRYGEEIDNLALAFNQMQERVRILIEELRSVTNNIAHDLRSPLTRIRGLAETTLTGGQNLTEYQETAGAVIEECDKMVSMVNTMLEIAEADAGMRKLLETSVDMAAIVRDVGELFLTVAEDKGVEIQVAVPDAQLMVRGDRTRLQRAVANLLDNAIKYTPSGGKVTLSARGESSQVLISIADTGIGIPQGEQGRIFDRFCRLDQSRSTPGSGLGLSLVQAVVHSHGGKVQVGSEVGLGSVFTIRLPEQSE